jgi:hypothetical protein
MNKFHRLIWEVRDVPRLWELYLGICLTTEENADTVQYKNNEQYNTQNTNSNTE